MNNNAAFLGSIPLFAELNAAELHELGTSMIRRQIVTGTVLFHQGDPGQTLFVVERGRVRLFALGEDGHERTVGLCGPRELFGELALIDDRPRSASAVALEPTIVYVLSRERFHAWVERSPQLALSFMRLLSARVRATTEQVGSMAFHSVPSRLAQALLDLAHTYGEEDALGTRLVASLTQSELASLIGSTRESINKTLRTFQRQGLILVRQGQIVILDQGRLAQQR
jgi:CRP/FNR family transcriptional regulator, cyclic AMP receptor protein